MYEFMAISAVTAVNQGTWSLMTTSGSLCYNQVLLPRVKLLTSHTKTPTRDNIKRALKEGFKTAGKEDLVLVFFSGHGFTVKQDHFLLPQDFRLG